MKRHRKVVDRDARAVCAECGEVMSRATSLEDRVVCEECRRATRVLHFAGSPHPATPRSQREYDGSLT